MREGATLKLDAGDELRVEADRDELSRAERSWCAARPRVDLRSPTGCSPRSMNISRPPSLTLPGRPIGCLPPIGNARTDGRALPRHVCARASAASRARRRGHPCGARQVRRLVVERSARRRAASAGSSRGLQTIAEALLRGVRTVPLDGAALKRSPRLQPLERGSNEWPDREALQHTWDCRAPPREAQLRAGTEAQQPLIGGVARQDLERREVHRAPEALAPTSPARRSRARGRRSDRGCSNRRSRSRPGRPSPGWNARSCARSETELAAPRRRGRR